MRRSTFLMGSAACALVLAAAPAAQAANPDIQRFQFSETDDIEDFCGTGETVRVTTTVKGVDFLDPNGNVEFRSVAHGTQNFTFEGTTVLGRFANLVVDDVQDVAGGGVRFEQTFVGLPEHFRLPGQGVITLDAGTITFAVEFDDEGNVVEESATWRGPHPEAASDFTLFCDVMVDALGLPQP